MIQMAVFLVNNVYDKQIYFYGHNSLRHEWFFSFVCKFACEKNVFLLDLQKSNQHIEMKIKTWY